MGSTPAGWDPVRAVAACRVASWHGEVWRCHRFWGPRGEVRSATDYAYTRESIGRWHRGRDHPDSARFPALYTSESGYVAQAEFLRHLEDRRRLDGKPLDLRVDRFRISEIGVSLSRVVDLRDLAALGLQAGELYDDHGYAMPQQLAAAAHARGLEAVLVWSAAVEPLGAATNLVVLPTNLRPDSRLDATGRWMAIRLLATGFVVPPSRLRTDGLLGSERSAQRVASAVREAR